MYNKLLDLKLMFNVGVITLEDVMFSLQKMQLINDANINDGYELLNKLEQLIKLYR